MGEVIELADFFEAGPFDFLGKITPTSSLIKDFDWGATSLGDISTWPVHLKSIVSLMLQSPILMTLLVGEDGILLYNEGYAVVAGSRHPEILGAGVREAWPENADFNDNVMMAGMAGRSLSYIDQEITLQRNGIPEQVWFDLFYSPVLDEMGRPVGVLAVVIETTDRVRAQKRIATEHHRLQMLFEQAPTFMAMLSGPDHTFEMLNPECSRLVGGRDVIGKSLAQALPEIVAQGFLPLLDQTFETGEPVTRSAAKVLFNTGQGTPGEEHYLDFVFQPIRDADGKVSHIFVQGSDVTQRVRGEKQQNLLIAELNHRVKNSLASVQSIVAQTLRSAPSVEDARVSISSRIMALSRAHDVLNRQHWDGADLGEIIKASVRPLVERAPGRIEIAGPKVKLTTRAALSLSFAFHELAANAVTHGALASEDGVIRISWTANRDGDHGNLQLTWVEAATASSREPGRAGFGTKVILRAMPIELGGTATLAFEGRGIVYDLRLPMANIEEST